MPTGHPLMGEPDPECLMTCPYNPAHRISRKRFQFHLTKCRKGYPNAKKEVCPFNATHMVNEQEFKFHLEVCPNKGIVDNFKYVTPNEAHIIELPPEPVLPPSEENWDDEYCETYDPTVKLAEAPIIHTFIGGTQSERKKCKVLQRQKFRALDESSSSSSNEFRPKAPKKEPIDQPMRQPTTRPPSIADNSIQCALLNESFASGTTNTSRTSKIQAKTAAVKLPNTVPGDPWNLSRPGPSQQSDDGFIEFRSKNRGNSRR